MIKVKTKLSGKYFGTLNKDINKKREGFQGIREFMSIWRNGMNKPVEKLVIYCMRLLSNIHGEWLGRLRIYTTPFSRNVVVYQRWNKIDGAVG